MSMIRRHSVYLALTIFIPSTFWPMGGSVSSNTSNNKRRLEDTIPSPMKCSKQSDSVPDDAVTASMKRLTITPRDKETDRCLRVFCQSCYPFNKKVARVYFSVYSEWDDKSSIIVDSLHIASRAVFPEKLLSLYSVLEESEFPDKTIEETFITALVEYPGTTSFIVETIQKYEQQDIYLGSFLTHIKNQGKISYPYRLKPEVNASNKEVSWHLSFKGYSNKLSLTLFTKFLNAFKPEFSSDHQRELLAELKKNMFLVGMIVNVEYLYKNPERCFQKLITQMREKKQFLSPALISACKLSEEVSDELSRVCKDYSSTPSTLSAKCIEELKGNHDFVHRVIDAYWY